VLCNWQENEPSPGIPQVNVDFYHAGELAAQHLLSLGHRRIAIIVDEPQQTSRLEGFRTALLKADVTLQSDMIQQGYSTLESGHAAAKKLLASSQLPTAIFATTDWMAIGALEAIREEGLRVPEDLSIIGLDDVVVGAHISPSLTTIAIPKHQLAKEATELLLRQIDGKSDPSESILLLPSLLIRHSTTMVSSTKVGDEPPLPIS